MYKYLCMRLFYPKKNKTLLSALKKISILIFFIVLTTDLSATAEKGDKVTIKLKNATLKVVINQIEKQTDYLFVYDEQAIDINQKVSINMTNSKIEDVLANILSGTDVTYLIEGKNIILKKKSKSSNTGIPGNRKIKGVVVDANGEPIIGATVVDRGTKIGTITDFRGNFSLDVTDKSIVQVSYIGYIKNEFKVNTSNEYTIQLVEDIKSLNEVVVIGYGTITKKEMTSAISHVSSKDFLSSSSLDASMLIQGKVSGVSISNIGAADPSRQASIQIRGVSSRNAGLDPLIVIDGIPGGNMTNVNSEDIESIDVLKDGAASAIYGTRASNGVIMITTKKGSKDGNLYVKYNSSISINKAKNELDILNSEQYRAYRTFNNTLLDKGADTDWLNEITRLGISHKHTLTISGGKPNSNYRASIDYRDANGIDLRSNREEYGARIHIDHASKNNLLNFTFNASPRVINREKSDWSAFTAALWANPTTPVFNSNGNTIYSDFIGEAASYNPVERLTLDDSGTEIKLLDVDVTAKINILPMFSNSGNENTSLSTQITVSQSHIDKFDYFFRPSISNEAINSGYSGEASRAYDNSIENKLEWVTNFVTQIDNHKLRLMAGYSYQYEVHSGLSGSNKDFVSDALTYNNLGSGEYLSAASGRTGVDSYKNDSKLIGFFARVNYDWKERYLFTASFRREGSSRFGYNHKWGNFPAVSAGWRISEESFLKGVSWINELKIRGDFGITGNQNIGNYNSLATYSSFGKYSYNGTHFNVWGPGKNTNSDLRWEKGYNKNIGLDFSIIKNKVSGSVNYYHRKQVDLLGSYSVPVPPNLFSTIYANVGTLRNQGVEIDLNFDLINRKDFKYQVGLVGSTNDNKFVSFSNEIYDGEDYYWTCSMSNPNNPGYLQQIRVNERIGNYVTFKYAGVDSNGNWLIYNSDNDIIPINEGTNNDKRITGNGLPQFTGSMTNNFSYKNWDLTVFLRAALGFDIFNVHDFYWGLKSGEGNVLKYAFSKNAHITTGKNVISDYFIEKGDFLKLDMVTLGYRFNIKNKFINSLRMYGTANNLFTLTRFLGVDPSTYEVNGLTPGTYGGSISYYPSAFQFILGLSVDL